MDTNRTFVTPTGPLPAPRLAVAVVAFGPATVAHLLGLWLQVTGLAPGQTLVATSAVLVTAFVPWAGSVPGLWMQRHRDRFRPDLRAGLLRRLLRAALLTVALFRDRRTSLVSWAGVAGLLLGFASALRFVG